MARIQDIRRETLNPRQQALYDDMTRRRPRPSLSGPFAIWMHIPDIAESTNALTNYLRSSAKLDQRLMELIILLMCRDGNVKYAWSVHEPLARAAGLAPETIDAIAARKRPDFKHDDEALIYDIVTELQATKTLSASTFDRAQAELGRERLIEAVTCAGFYAMVGFALNAFDIAPQPGRPVLT